jgi:predicted Zn-dependent peptidase
VPSLPGEFRPKIELERFIGGYPLAPADPGIRVSDTAVRSLASRALAANLVVFGVGGNVALDDVAKAIDRLTLGWQPAPEPTPNAPTMNERASPQSVFTVDVPSLEGWVAIGRAIGPVTTLERAPLAVAAEILSTRLNVAVREVRGLANRTVCLLPTSASGAGLLHVRSGGRPESVGPIVKFSLDEIRRMHSAEDSIGVDELQTAKGALVLGLWQTSLDGARSATMTFAMEAARRRDTAELLSWPQAVNAVTAAQVKQMANKYLDPDRMQTAIVGPIDTIRRARHPRWPVDLDSLR